MQSKKYKNDEVKISKVSTVATSTSDLDRWIGREFRDDFTQATVEAMHNIAQTVDNLTSENWTQTDELTSEQMVVLQKSLKDRQFLFEVPKQFQLRRC